MLKKGSHSDSGNESDSKKKNSLTHKKNYDNVNEGHKKEHRHKSRAYQEVKNKDGKASYDVAIKHG